MRALQRSLAAGSVLIGTVALASGPQHPAAAAAVPECRTADLRASIGGQQGGAGSIFTTLVLRNVGHAACLVHGYPGVSLVDRHGHQIGRSAHWVAAPALPIILQPGQKASTVIRTLNPGVGTTACLPPSAALRVYPPDQRAALLVPVRLSECLGRLEMRPLIAGSAGM